MLKDKVKLFALSMLSVASAQFECPRSQRHHLVCHETDCAKFYYCEYGVRRNDARQCPARTLFSFEKQVCDHPRNVICRTNNNGGCSDGGNNCDCSNRPILPNGCPCNHSIRQLLPHETDCTKFYQCDKGKKILRECAPGTHFNAKLQVCDHPSSAGCDPNCGGEGGETGGGSDGDGETGGGDNCDCPNGPILPNGCPCNHSIHQLLPHETDCTKFYQCDKGKKILRECAPGTHFNAKLQVCDHPSSAGCDPNCGGDGGETGGGSDGDGETGGGDNCDCPNGPILPNGCPCNHSIHQLLPHETDCTKFYQCDKGKKVLRECAPGTHFNAKLQVCDHPSSAGCDPNCDGEGGETGGGSDGDGETGGGDNCDCPNGQILPNGCPCNHSIHQLLPHETDCTKFYQCDKGKKVLRECAPGTHFNAKLQVCDHPSSAGCDPNCGGDGGETGGGSDGDGETGGGDNCDCPNGPILPNGCPCNHSIQLLLPHETDCTKFYQCDKGKKVLRECAPGTHFNAKLQVCDHPSSAGCDPNCGGDGGETGGGSDGDGETGGGDNCDCPIGPILPNGCPCNHSIHQLLPHETDCTKFYQCDKGKKVLRECAPGTHFNAKLQVCDHPSSAGCDPNCGGDGGETGGGSDGDGETGGGDNCDCPNGPILPNGCPCNHSIHQLLPHETDCTKFYQCDKGQKVLKECAPGKHFNAKLQICDCPSNAGCENKCKNCHVPHWRDEIECNKFWRCVGEKQVLYTCPEGLYYNEARQTCDFKCNVNCLCKNKTPYGLNVFFPWLEDHSMEEKENLEVFNGNNIA
ncbi:unnamed protein product [Leptosia nina]|uniref:Chitin-binding type-2 domain-containing protein n=1 Tax=Leptosia nina TaxID=320188 RepID=A0AAV1JI79_9NEOP